MLREVVPYGGGGGSQTLAQTLINGNTTGGTSIVVSSGATIISAASTNLVLTTSSAGQFVEVVEAPGGGSGFYVFTPQGHYALLTTDVENSTSGTQQFVLTQPKWTDSGSNSTTVAQTLLINPTIDYTAASATGHYEALNITVVETSLPTPAGPLAAGYMVRYFGGSAGTTELGGVDRGGSVYSGPYSTSMTAVFGQGTMRLESTGYYAITSSNALNGTIDTVLARRAGGNFGIYQSTTIADTNLGFVSCANLTMLNSSGAFQIDISTGTAPAVTLSSTGTFDWTSNNAGGVPDSNLSRNAAGVVQFGTTAANIAGFAAASGFSVGNGTPVTTAGTVAWVSGLGAFTAAAPHVLGPSDQNFFISGATPGGSGTGNSLTLSGGQGNTSGGGGLLTTQGGQGVGTNQNGGGMLLSAGAPTGTGTSNFHLQTGFTLGSSSTNQTLGDRLYIAGHSVTMSTTTATATTITTLNVPTSGSGGGCIVYYNVVATDGTNYSTATGSFSVSAVNKAGTVTAAAASITDESSQNSPLPAGLTAGTTSTSVTSTAVAIRVAPAWMTLVPTSVICTVTVISHGNGVTITPA